jgi:hypothetical protein
MEMKHAATSATAEAFRDTCRVVGQVHYPPLNFPVRKPVSNEAKQRDIYFPLRRSVYSSFDMSTCE